MSLDPDEALRQKALQELDILDSPPEAIFDDLTEMARDLFDVPIALISLIDEGRHWFKSHSGLDLHEMPRAQTFCDLSMGSTDVTIILDALDHETMAANDLVLQSPHIRFYAGAPIIIDQVRVGTFCLVDQKPRSEFDAHNRKLLQRMAKACVAALKMRSHAYINKDTIEKLAVSEQNLSMMERIAKVGYWQYDYRSQALIWSKGMWAIVDEDPESFNPMRRGALSYYHIDDRRRVAKAYAAAHSRGQPFDLECRIQSGKKKSFKNIHLSAQIQLDANGNPHKLFGVIRDITEAVQAQTALKIASEGFQDLANKSKDIISIIGTDTRFEYISPAVTTIMGYLPQELLGRKVSDFIHTDDYARVLEVYQNYARQADWTMPLRIQYRARAKDGRLIWFETQSSPIVDARTGQLNGFQDMVRDISIRKKFESELIKATQVAKSAIEAKSLFLASMSHEIRTPLTSIIGFSALLQDSPDLDQQALQFSKRIHSASKSLLCLINDVLDNAKLEEGKLMLEPQACDIKALGQDVCDLLSIQAQTNDVTLKLEVSDTLNKPLWIDEQRLRQILHNLVGNGIKFTNNGEVSLTIEAIDDTDDSTSDKKAVSCAPRAMQSQSDEPEITGPRLRFTIRDTGIGISENGLRQLFKPYNQVDAGPHKPRWGHRPWLNDQPTIGPVNGGRYLR